MSDNPILRISLKKNIWSPQTVCDAGSHLLYNFQPTVSSTVHSILKQDSRFMIVEPVVLEEFASGSMGYNTLNPQPNPITGDYAGGSSVGSAVSVLLNYADVSVGTDTGGSCRVPALLCGLFGFKPSYGLISRHGVLDLCNYFDTVGLISKTLKDLLLVFSALCAGDEKQSTCLPFGPPVESNEPLSVVSCDILDAKNPKKMSLYWAKDIISDEYERVSNQYFYSNLLRLDGRRFNDTIEGYKNQEDAIKYFEEGVLPVTLNRFNSGRRLLREKPKASAEYCVLRASLNEYAQSYLVFRPKSVLRQYGTPVCFDEIREMEFPFLIANLLGRPSVMSDCGLLIIGPVYSDYILLERLKEIIEMAK